MLIDIHKTDLKGNFFTLREPLLVSWHEKAILVPVGFESDGASVPRFFWRVVFPPGDNRAIRASFVHDFIYRTHPAGWTKAEADQMFYEILVADGIPRRRAYLAYLGVKLFGASAWEAGGK